LREKLILRDKHVTGECFSDRKLYLSKHEKYLHIAATTDNNSIRDDSCFLLHFLQKIKRERENERERERDRRRGDRFTEQFEFLFIVLGNAAKVTAWNRGLDHDLRQTVTKRSLAGDPRDVPRYPFARESVNGGGGCMSESCLGPRPRVRPTDRPTDQPTNQPTNASSCRRAGPFCLSLFLSLFFYHQRKSKKEKETQVVLNKYLVEK